MAVSIIHPKQLGTGTRDGTKFLRDDGTWQTAGGGVSDGDKGDVVVSGSGAVWTLEDAYKNNFNINVAQVLGSPILAETLNGFQSLSTASNLQDNFCRFHAVWLPKNATITGVLWCQNTQGNYTADNYNGVGLYTYDGAGNLTLVASSTDDGNIWKGTSNSVQSKAFSATYSAQKGIYFVAALYNSSAQTTAPSLNASVNISNAIPAMDFSNSAKFCGLKVSSNSLPASVAMSAISASSTMFYFGLY